MRSLRNYCRSTITWDEVGGLEKVTLELQESVQYFCAPPFWSSRPAPLPLSKPSHLSIFKAALNKSPVAPEVDLAGEVGNSRGRQEKEEADDDDTKMEGGVYLLVQLNKTKRIKIK